MPIIVIDAGHGGTIDSGRSTWGGVRGVEKEVTLDLARRVAAHLGGHARLTRDSDTNLPLSARAEAARQAGAAAFVSIHAADGPAQVLVHPRARPTSHALARALSPAVHAAEMAVLAPERHAPATAACLVECGTPSSDPRWLDATSRSIAHGLRRYFGAQALDMRRDGTISPFNTGFTSDPWIVDNTNLTAALTEFKANVFAGRRVPFAIVALSDTPDDPATPNVFAGDQIDDLDFIASLAKVAAMYASFELRFGVRDVAKWSVWTSDTDLWALCRRELDPQIASAVATITNHATPQYEQIFQVLPDRSIDFTAAHLGSLRSMIEQGSNTGAQGVITRLGFQCINGALAARGLFNPGTSKGLWLTGDFVTTPLRLANTINDQLVGQAGTVRAVAKLFTLVAQRSLVQFERGGNDEMLTLLANSRPTDPPFIARNSDISLGGVARTRSFDVIGNKLGLAGLKAVNGGFNVHSEGSILQHRDTGRRFVVAWQNMKAASNADFRTITRLADLVIEKFVSP